MSVTSEASVGETTNVRPVIEELATWFLATLGMALDTNPLDTRDLPERAAKPDVLRTGKPYWTLTREGRKSERKAFGHPDGYLRRVTHSFVLTGYWPFTGAVAKHPAWNDYVDSIADQIEAHRRMGGLVRDTNPPEISGSAVRRAQNGMIRYHTVTIRFTIWANDRLKVDGQPE